METSNWQAVGIVWQEPKLYYNKTTGKTMARAILGILPGRYDKGKYNFLPVTAFGKQAQVFVHVAHKGSFVFCTGTLYTNTTTTNEQAKTLIQVTCRVKDVVVLKREEMKLDDIDFVGMSQLYDPESFLDLEVGDYDEERI